jgi:hypothetical protein
MSVALLLVIENSKTNLGAGEHWRNEEYTRPGGEPLEEEAIRCVKSWRKYYSKDVNIYCICPSNRVPQRRTIDQLKEYDVTYIERYFSETENFTCGYWNVPLACAWLEGIVNEDILIHTDLDMKLIKPIPINELLNYGFFVIARVGALPDEDMKDIHIYPDLLYHHESNFIISKREDYFYNSWLEELNKLEKIYTDPTWERYAELEEFAVDNLHRKNGIESIQYYQVGPRYRAKDIPDDKLDQIYFIHRHPYESNEEYGRYLKKYLKWKK